MKTPILALLAALLLGCPSTPTVPPTPSPAPDSALADVTIAPPTPAPVDAALPAPSALDGATETSTALDGATEASLSAMASGGDRLTLVNMTDQDVTAYWAFGANSAVTSWSVCKATAKLNATCAVPKKGSLSLPLKNELLSASLSFAAPVSCGSTKAEFTINNPSWADVVDLSLVDGYNVNVAIEVAGQKTLGPIWSKTNNEKNYGVFPVGCDVCTSREHPPCGLIPGKAGCKTGTPTKPDVVCQVQEPNGPQSYRVVYFGHDQPAAH